MTVRTVVVLTLALFTPGFGSACSTILGIDGEYDDQAGELSGNEPDAGDSAGSGSGGTEAPDPPGAGGHSGRGATAGNDSGGGEAGNNSAQSGTGGSGAGGSTGGGASTTGGAGGSTGGGASTTGGAGGSTGGGASTTGGAGGSTGGGASTTGGTGGSAPSTGAGGSSGGNGLRVRAVQSGGALLETGSLSVSATIDAVDLGRSFLVFGSLFDSTSSSFTQLSGRLANATTVVFERAASSNSAPDVPVHFYVAEFEDGVSVQHGSRVLETSTLQLTLGSAVDPSKSIPLVTLRNASGYYAQDDFVRAEISGSSELTLSTYNAMSSGAAAWQVVSFEDAATQVQSETVLLPAAQTTLVVPLEQAIDTSRAWLTMSYELLDTSQAAQQMLVRGAISASGQLTFERAAAGPNIRITYYLVEFGDSTRVQSGVRHFLGSELSAAIPLAAVEPSKSIALANGSYQRAGTTSLATGGNLGVSTFWLTLDGGAELTLSRAASGSEASLDWSVISFP